MPVLTSTGAPAVTDLAAKLVEDINAGRTARQVIDAERKTAFAWTTGLPYILARLVTASVVDGLTFTASKVKPSATPAKKVAEGATKPNAVDVTSAPHSLNKYAGLANITTERALDTDSLIPALVATIGNGALMAFDADCAAELDANSGLVASGTSWPAGILAGIGAVASAGGAPSVLVLSASDYAAAVQSPGPGYAMNPVDGVPALFGLQIVMSAAIAAGKAYVLDPSGVMAVEYVASPLVVVDPYSSLETNAIRVAVEYFAACVVTSPGVVCEVTVTIA